MNTIKIKTPKQKILLIEFYLIHKTNGIKAIALDLDLPYGSLNYHVKKYEADKCLILPSKMN